MRETTIKTTAPYPRAVRRRRAALAAATVLAGLAAAQQATGATSVSGTYAQVGPRGLSVFAMVAGAPRGAIAVVETKRFSRTPAGRARSLSRPLSRRGRATITLAAPRGSAAITARIRVVVRVKRKGRLQTVTVKTGRWTTITFTRTGRAAPVAAVKAAEIASVSAPTDTTTGTMHLTGSSAKVTPGQVIALGITPQTPDGLLAQVTEVAPAAGGVDATLVPARLSDVVPAGEITIDIPTERFTTLGKTTSDRTPRALQCDTSRSATATASVELSSGLSMTAKWTGGSILPPRAPKLNARVTAGVEAKLEGQLSLDGQASCTLTPQTLFPSPVRLAAFTVQVGPVPVPVIITGQVTLTGSAQASGSISTSVTASARAEASVSYANGTLTPDKSFTRAFTFQRPTVNGTGSAQVALSPAIGVKLAGAAGPEVDLTGGLKLTGNLRAPVGEPWWKLTAPVSLGAKFAFSLWGLEAQSPRYVLWSEEPVVAQADPATGAPGSAIIDQGLAPQPLPQGVRTRLTWDSDTDVDLHTWNQYGDHAYFIDKDAIEGGYLDQDVIPGYGPETFYETDPSLGNRFTFGVCQFSGENANVTVDVRDPDGTTRRFTVVLRGRKAAALLTTSPAGITPYVDAETSWCDHGGGPDPTRLGQVTTGTFS